MRLTYALGNLAARCDIARSSIFSSRQTLKELCQLCQRYTVELRQNAFFEGESLSHLSGPAAFMTLVEGSHSSVNDVLVKLIRVIANASIGAEAGYLASIVPECTSLLIDTTRECCLLYY